MQHDPRFTAKLQRRTKAAELILHLLVLEDLDAWMDASPALARRLSESDLKALAYAALRALPVEAADDVLDAAFGADRLPLAAGDPLGLEQARAEARAMCPATIKAMARACVERMPPRTRSAFCDWLSKRLGRA